jgi:hypothetical protein
VETLVRLIGPIALQVSPVVEQRFREVVASTGYTVAADPSLYGIYPYLFTGLAREMPDEILLDLCHFCRAYASYSIWMDKVMDQQVEVSASLLLAARRAHEEALRLVLRLSEARPELWLAFTRYREENDRAILAEASLSLDHIKSIPLERYREIGAGKVAVAKVSLTALALFTGRSDWIPRLEQMHDLQAQGLQLADDVQDWKEDLRAGRPSYPLALFFRTYPGPIFENQTISSGLRMSILSSDCFDRSLALAEECFTASLAVAQSLDCTGWANLVRLNLERVSKFRKELAVLRQRLTGGAV